MLNDKYSPQRMDSCISKENIVELSNCFWIEFVMILMSMTWKNYKEHMVDKKIF